MNSGESPLLLEKTQAAYLANVTVRDGFATCRPPFTKNLTIVYPSAEVQEVIEEGLFQGALPEMYRPDAGAPSQIASISGRIFQFQLVGDVFTVTEITIPGDPNPDSSTQAWLWQAENFVIIQDGINLPIFWDGATSRRSYGPTHLLATQDAGPVAKPVVAGAQVTLTLTAPYTGPYNVPVLIDGEFYQPIANAAGYLVTATNYTATPGEAITEGDQVIIRSDVFGVQAVNVSFGDAPGTYPAGGVQATLTLTLPYAGSLGSGVIMLGKIWTVVAISGVSVLIRVAQAITILPTDGLTAGQILLKSSSSSPNVVIGLIAVGTSTVAPAIGADVQLTLDSAYSGLPDQQ